MNRSRKTSGREYESMEGQDDELIGGYANESTKQKNLCYNGSSGAPLSPGGGTSSTGMNKIRISS